MTLNYVIWDVNPYIFTFPENFPLLGGRPVAWYGLLWALVFVVGYYVMRKMYRKENLSDELLDKLTIYMLVFSVVGARLGHCLFYEPEYYLIRMGRRVGESRRCDRYIARTATLFEEDQDFISAHFRFDCSTNGIRRCLHTFGKPYEF